MPISIRVAEYKDAHAVSALWLELMREHEQMDERWKLTIDAEERWFNDFRWLVEDSAHLFLVASCSGNIVGFTHAYLWEDLPIYAPVLEVFIASIYVNTEYRKQGAASRMVNYVKLWAADKNAMRVRLGILAANAGGAGFWNAMGAEAISVFYTLPVYPDENNAVQQLKSENPGQIGF